MPRIPTPQGRHQYQTGAALPNVSARSTPSAVSTSGAVYSIPVPNQRTPSPMSKQMGPASAISNYVSVVPPPNFGSAAATTNALASSSLANPSNYVNGSEASAYLTSASGHKKSHITVNLQSPPRNGSRGNGSTVADSQLVRERAAPIMQADKRQVEKPIAQSAVSPTIIAVNNNSPSMLGQSKLTGVPERQDATPGRQPSTKVLSAHFDPKNLQAVRINVQGASDPNSGGQLVMNYHLEANTTSGHVVSIQGRGECASMASTTAASTMDAVSGETSPYGRQRQPIRPAAPSSTIKSSQRILLSSPLDTNMVSSGEALSNHEMMMKTVSPLDYSLVRAQLQQQQAQVHQQQQQLPSHHHRIVVDGNGSGDNSTGMDDSLEQQQQAFAQRLKLTSTATTGTTFGHHQMTGIPVQKREPMADGIAKGPDARSTLETYPSTSTTATAPPIASFVPLPARLAMSRTIDCFPPLKEESMSQNAPLPSRTDRASPTSSVSTEESENSGCGGNSVATMVAAATNGNASEPLVRCESPLPDSVLERYKQCKEDGAQASASTSGNSNGSARCVKPCTPQAFKFFMEQHVENVIKQHQERQTRRMQVRPFLGLVWGFAVLTSIFLCSWRKRWSKPNCLLKYSVICGSY